MPVAAGRAPATSRSAPPRPAGARAASPWCRRNRRRGSGGRWRSRSAWPPSSPIRRCSTPRWSRCARRPRPTGCAWSPTTARRPSITSGYAPSSATIRASSLAPGAGAAGLLPQLRARDAAGARRGGPDRAVRPGRPLAPRQARKPAGAIGGAGLVYSDQRLVEADGRVLRDTMWEGRRNNHDDLVSMLVANSITGAAMLMRRDVAELSLPFPDTPAHAFHDAWLALVALAAGESPTSTARSTTTCSTAGRSSAPSPTASGRRGAAAAPRARTSAATCRAPCSRGSCSSAATPRRASGGSASASWRRSARGPRRCRLAARSLRHHARRYGGSSSCCRGSCWRRLAPRFGMGREPARPRQLRAEAAAALAGARLSARLRSFPRWTAPVVIEARGVEKTFRIPHHRVDTLKERASTRSRAAATASCARCGASRSTSTRASSSGSSAATAREEHAAEDPVEHLPRRRRAGADGRAAGAVHRARRRLQPRADRRARTSCSTA